MVREEYLTPVVVVVEVMVEKGYASSPFLENPEEGVKLKILGGYDANGAFYHSDYDINAKTNLNY
jgi:hypothetical protein